MTDPADRDLDTFAETWRTSEYTFPNVEVLGRSVRARAAQATRRARWILALEILGTVIVFALLARGLPWSSPFGPWGWTFAVVHAAIVWIANVWPRRGTWRDESRTSHEYLAILRARTRAVRIACEACAVLLAVEAIALLIHVSTRPTGFQLTAAGITVFAAVATWCAVLWRWARRQLRRIDGVSDRM